ncbi:MAG: hypothetical protein E7160_01200 [Firmicutes bacterium]|nr:hypothetical protein [Bacillota bacterium]
MKKIISFDKSLDFNSMIGDISSISIDHTLKFIDRSNITGEFLVSGSYKLTEASRLEEKFEFKIPVEIILNEVLDLTSTDIEIVDFSYKLENNDTLTCHIEVKIEGVEEINIEEDIEKLEVKEENNILNRECDSEIKQNIKNDPQEKIKEMEESEETNKLIESKESSNVGSLFSSFKDSDETFSTYSVYIMRNNDTIETVMNKYKITKEQLEEYNDVGNINVGSKIIIPTTNAEN